MKLYPHVVRLSTGTLFCRYCHTALRPRGDLDDHTHDPTVPARYGGGQTTIDDGHNDD